MWKMYDWIVVGPGYIYLLNIQYTSHLPTVYLRTSSTGLNDNVALQIYKSMLLPFFDYVDVIFHKSNTGELDKLQRLQNKCLRMSNLLVRNASTGRLHKISKVPFLKDRRKAHVLNFMFIRKNKPELLNVREIRTRGHDAPLFNVPIPRREAFKRSIVYSGSVEWNSLGAEARNVDAFLPFKFHKKNDMLAPLSLIV